MKRIGRSEKDVDSLESASTTDVSIWRPGTVQYFLSRRPFSSRDGTNPILNYLGSGSSPWLLAASSHSGVNFRCEYTTRLRNPMRLLEHTFLGLGYRRVLFRESNVCAPIYKRLGITKRTGWHTFRRTYTTPLNANGEDVKVVQELLRHGSSRITMDVYAQAVTPAKRNALGKVVAMLRVMKKEEKLG